MFKIILIIFFSTLFSYSQKKEIKKEKKIVLDYINSKFCENPFSTQTNKEFDYKMKIIKQKNQLYFEFVQGNYKNEIKSNGEIILKLDHKYEELEIYSLTEKEKEKCFFYSKFIKEFDIEDIKRNKQNNGYLVYGKIEKLNLNIEVEIKYPLNNKEDKILYKISSEKPKKLNNTGKKQEIIFYEKYEFENNFKELFSYENFNIKSLKEKYNTWEIIDFR